MKNLIGAVAPKNRVLGSFKMLMLVLLVTIGFTSCKDQFKSQVSPETELTAKRNLHDLQINFDIGGKGTGTGTGEIGGQSFLRILTDIGGRQSGGTGNYVLNDIGGVRGTSTGPDIFSRGQFNQLKNNCYEFD